MAKVYLSKMRLGGGLDRLVALKTIHEHLANNQTFVNMFLDEARIASQISHPNVCSVYDFGDAGDVYYLAMEYLVGEPLFDVINRIVKDRSEDLMAALPYIAARIIADACEGLHAAHELRSSDGKHLGVVHRDVSPQNLFITYEGAVKVVDFGCAKALERVTQTNTGVMKGKVSYAAPEQFRGEEVDARADIFALGICLWETLTLRQLFRRETSVKTAMAVLEEPIPRANASCPWVPAELADIAEKALHRDPTRRYQSARDMGRALRAFVARTGVPFESAELAEWMQHLFSDRHQQVLNAVAEVEAMEIPSSDVANVPKLSSATASASDASGQPTGLAHANTPHRRERAPALDIANEKRPAPSSSAGRTFLITAVILALVGAGVFLLFGDQFRAALAPGEEPVELANEGADPSEEPEDPESTETGPDEAGSEEMGSDETGSDETGSDETGSEESDPTGESAEATDPESANDTPSNVAAMEGSSREESRESRRESRRERERDETTEGETDEMIDDAYFATGSIRIEAHGGWAVVSHQGTRLGRTPISATLPVGPQVLTVFPYGNEPSQQVTIRIEPGTLRRLSVDVDPRDDPARMSATPTE